VETDAYYSRQRSAYPDQMKKLRQLQRCLGKYHYQRANKVGEVCTAITDLLEQDRDLSPLVEALAQWCLEYMRNNRLTGTRVKPTSMSTFLSSIGPALIRHAAELNILTMSVEDWDNLYDQVLENTANSRSRDYKAGRLITFHRFLMMSYPVPPVSIEQSDRRRPNVDSNIITPQEYKDCPNIISRDIYQSERLRRMQRLLLILGYRCGLRRGEAITLQIHYLQDEQGLDLDAPLEALRPELIIRNNIQGHGETRQIDRATFALPFCSPRVNAKNCATGRPCDYAKSLTRTSITICSFVNLANTWIP